MFFFIFPQNDENRIIVLLYRPILQFVYLSVSVKLTKFWALKLRISFRMVEH